MPLKPHPSTPTSTTRVDKRSAAKAAIAKAATAGQAAGKHRSAASTSPRRKPPAPDAPQPARDGRRGNVITSDAIDYTDEEMAFMRAVQTWKKRTGKLFPALSEILAIVRELGYRKV
jgi:hypothetical protein